MTASQAPLQRVSEASPQKTLPQKTKAASETAAGDGEESGPALDFADPDVVAREEDLRSEAASLEAAIEAAVPSGPSEPDGGYSAAAAALETRLPLFHARYEAYVRAAIATGTFPVTCRSGCGSCCSHYVSSVEPFELIYLHGRIRKDPAYPSRLVAFHRRASLFQSLLADARRAGHTDEEADDRALFRYFLRGQPCPFLSASGDCGVYRYRPMTCRMFFSQSHPSLCRGKAAASPGNRNFIVELPDDIEATLARAASLLAHLELPESLFGGLLEANARFGPWDQDQEAGT